MISIDQSANTKYQCKLTAFTNGAHSFYTLEQS